MALLTLGNLSAANDFQYPTFADSSGLRLLRDATIADGRLRLTDAVLDMAGAAWRETQIDALGGFETQFTFQISDPLYGGADGFAFVVQAASLNERVDLGCALGYEGIANSIAIEFDRYLNTSCTPEPDPDPDASHISIHTRGALPNDTAEAFSIGRVENVAALQDGAPHAVRIRFADGLLSIFLDGAATPSLEIALELAAELNLPDGRAWVGFTAATGGAAERYEILNWSLTELQQPALAAYPPAMPEVGEPPPGRIINPADVHMECAPLRDRDGHTHVCTDWEIWNGDLTERVWRASCAVGVSGLHIHLGNGVFEGSLAGQTALAADRVYAVVARHRDSGPTGRSISRDAVRRFRTAQEPALRPLVAQDVLDGLGLRWRRESDQLLELPAGATPARLVIEGGHDRFLEIVGRPEEGNSTTVFDAGDHPHTISAELIAGSEAVTLPPSQLAIWLDGCRQTTIYFPAISLDAGQRTSFWISESGATFGRAEDQEHPDLTFPLRAPTLPWAALQPDLQIDRVAGGFQLPVNIVFVPNAGPEPSDPLYYVVELYGSIRVVNRAGSVAVFAENLLNFDPTGPFPGTGEIGLASIAIDPVSGDIFATMPFAAIDNRPELGIFSKVERLRSNDGGHTLAQRTTVLELRDQQTAPSHQISNITIGPDGYLNVHVGDGFNIIDSRNIDSFLGKILRIDFNGAPAEDNPFYDAFDGISTRDFVWAYGLRNPFGGGWRQATGQHFIVENGSTVDRFALAVRGRDYLWDGTEDSTRNYALYNWFPAHAPVNIAFIEPSLFDGSGFPAEYQGKAYVTESGPTWAEGPQTLGKRIVQFDVAPDGQTAIGPETVVEYVGIGRATAVALAAGPDGLYFSDLYKDLDYLSPFDRGANIYRISHRPPLDCDRNGRSDLCELAEDWTLDADRSGFIDACEIGLGDMNCDGRLNGFDIRPFVTAIIAPDEYVAEFAGCPILHADLDFDGRADVGDIPNFISRYLALNPITQ
ncbi:MAG: PQQ-dependent sugar dehydrogenase [Phycisphaerae bacterium]|nr:PQQ-dependent sugar dehydrogenase [Phycisphaerae bacterium]